MVRQNSSLKPILLKEAHAGVEGGHSGVKKTLERIRRVFYWKKMRKEIDIFVAECEICQRNKDENVSYLDCYKHYLSQASLDRYIHGFYRGVANITWQASHICCNR